MTQGKPLETLAGTQDVYVTEGKSSQKCCHPLPGALNNPRLDGEPPVALSTAWVIFIPLDHRAY